MTKSEFIETLRNTLSTKLTYAQVNEHVRYYEEYIDEKIRMGEAEEDVLASLGDPRLLARTIMDTTPDAEEHADANDKSRTSSAENHNQGMHKRPLISPFTWAIIILILIVIGVLWVAGTILSFLAPVLLPLLLVIIIVRLFRRGGW